MVMSSQMSCSFSARPASWSETTRATASGRRYSFRRARGATRREYAQAHGLAVDAVIRAYATSAVEPRDLFFAPIQAVESLMRKEGKVIADYELIEVNEAFAVQAIADMRALGMAEDRVNVNGGAVALGHPIGASGARVLVTLLHALEQRGALTGLATLCLGGGSAVAMSIEKA
jgi:acetyl-CoA C-acetyltransferase